MRIYLTHCSKEKMPIAKGNGELYPPDELYTEPGIQQFMAICKQKEVNWAILSDNYGIFFPSDRRGYYEKPPASVTPEEELAIISQVSSRLLSPYDEIWFYIAGRNLSPLL